jgi:hypothetical protein
MAEWVKREIVETQHYSDIWDTEGWQINKAINVENDKPFVLIDANMPMMPCSPVCGLYATLEEAQAEAERRGIQDYSWYEG